MKKRIVLILAFLGFSMPAALAADTVVRHVFITDAEQCEAHAGMNGKLTYRGMMGYSQTADSDRIELLKIAGDSRASIVAHGPSHTIDLTRAPNGVNLCEDLRALWISKQPVDLVIRERNLPQPKGATYEIAELVLHRVLVYR